METPTSTRRRRVRPRRVALALTALAGAVPLLAGTTVTAPSAQADPGDAKRLRQLNKQVEKLDKAYGGDLAKLRDTEDTVKKAVEKTRLLKADLENARDLVARMASTQYMTGGADPAAMIVSADDPTNMLTSATLVSHLSQNQAAKVQQIQRLVTEQEKARREAQAKIKELEKEIRDLVRKKAQIKLLLKKYKPESPSVGLGGVTARMLKVKNTLDTEFGPFPTIGCFRSGAGAQDHALGKACDFMESTGGSMPSAERQRNGDAVAAYAIRNASSLGVKYVIWKQRIYDMRSPGWRGMSDRGGITANHFDHVHISVF